MICQVFVIRHAETTDNNRGVFSGWRDAELTPRGLEQSQKIADQLGRSRIDYAFTSHLKRARKTLQIVLREHRGASVFTDDRLIERCYGLLQGKSKKKLARENPDWFANVHRGYDFPPPEGESLKMVEKRTLPFLVQLNEWLTRNPGNVAISCHGNSMRPIRRVFEHLTLEQMLKIENPQDHALCYELNTNEANVKGREESHLKREWEGLLVPQQVRLATDPRNTLREYY